MNSLAKTSRIRFSMVAAAATMLMFASCPPRPSFAQTSKNVPEAEQGTGVDRYEGNQIDPNIQFEDEENNFVQIGDYFDGKRPIILSFNYSNCPNICSVQLEKMALALRDIDLLVEKDFQVVSVSIDPNEQAARAKQTKDKFTNMYNKPERNGGWHFLTGKETQIKTLAAQCGVRYKYIPQQKLYSHPPVYLLISPKGKITRYIYGLDYEPVTLKQALVEAAEGKIGSPINRLTYLTGCYLFDESSGKYSATAMGLMRIAGLLTVAGLCIGLLPYWLVWRKRTATDLDSGNVNAESASQIEPSIEPEAKTK